MMKQAAESYEILENGTRVFTDETHRFTSDGLLLAGFCPIEKQESICELGAGCGVVGFSLYDRGFRGRLCLVELNKAACGLLETSLCQNQMHNIEIHHGDLRAYKTARPFSLVVCNPPYYSGGPLPLHEGRAMARHALSGGIAEWCRAAASLLKDKGRLCLCYPPAGLPTLFGALCKNHLAPRKLQLVKHGPEKAPWLCLVEAAKAPGSKPFYPDGLRILPDKILERCEY